MAQFEGRLNSNHIQSALYNMIISIVTHADNIKGTYSQLVDEAREEVGLYGDKILKIDTDVLSSKPWVQDSSDALNVLALHRPPAPKTQEIVINNFRQIALTTDSVMSKMAFGDEGAFSNYTAVLMAWIYDTKKVFTSKLYNAFFGTVKGLSNKATYNIDITTAVGATTGVEKNKLTAEAIAEGIADLIVDMSDATRDYNDYKFLRSYDESEIKIVWNASWNKKIQKYGLPEIFNKDGLVDKFDQYVLPAKYFGRAVAAGDVGNNKVIGSDGEVDATKGTVRSKVEKEFVFSGVNYHLFPGDALSTGMKVDATGATVSNPDFAENEVYVEDADIICKVVTKLPVFAEAFSTGTAFYNNRNLSTNNYLTFGYGLDYLYGKPLIEVKKI